MVQRAHAISWSDASSDRVVGPRHGGGCCRVAIRGLRHLIARGNVAIRARHVEPGRIHRLQARRVKGRRRLVEI
jgi:hypothetical protein